MDEKQKLTDAELRKRLTPEQYHVLREKGTEAPFSGKYYNSHEKGMYMCAVCGAELFSSDAKFDSGTGWPSFTDPTNLEHVELREDRSHGTMRTEVLCKNCGSHLGHVFDDGPMVKDGNPPSSHLAGLRRARRYCINSVCLDFKPPLKK